MLWLQSAHYKYIEVTDTISLHRLGKFLVLQGIQEGKKSCLHSNCSLMFVKKIFLMLQSTLTAALLYSTKQKK